MLNITSDSKIFDLCNDLLFKAKKYHITINIAEAPTNTPSFAIVGRRYIFINENIKNEARLPSIICHEIGHIIDGDCYQKNKSIRNSEQEHRANEQGMNILIPAFLKYINDVNDDGLDIRDCNLVAIMNQLHLNSSLSKSVMNIARNYLIRN